MLIRPSILKKISYFLIFLFAILITSCTDSKKPGKYRLYFRGDNIHKEQIITIDDLSEGYINLTESGTFLSSDIYYDLYYHNGAYYDIDKPNKIKKYRINDEQLIFQDSCVIDNMTELETHSWVNDSTLLIVGLDHKHRNPTYVLIDTKRFVITQSGDIPIPDDGSYQRTSVGFASVSDSTVYITYVYHNTSPDNYTTSEAISLITLDYPEMTLRNNSTNNKTTYEMKNGRHQPTMAMGADNNFYFITNTSNGFGRMENIPSGILKIDTKEKDFDNSFFINLSDSLPHCYPTAIWHISENIFLVKCERTDLISSWNDYIDERVFEYYVLNTQNNNSLERLDLPMDTPWYTNNVIVNEGIAYIANNAEDGYTFWLFNSKDNTLVKGLKIDPSVKRIFSINLN